MIKRDAINSKYVVLGPNGKPMFILNSFLVHKQNISDEQLEALKLSHQLKHVLFEGARSTSDPLKLKLLAVVFDTLESEQQKLWNFPVNTDFHRFFDLPGCTCPKLDNDERLGTKYHIYSKNCKIHGLP